MKPTHVSLIQMDIEYGKKDDNLDKSDSLIKKAVSQAESMVPHIICLPELFSTGFDLKNIQKHAETIPGGKTSTFLQQTAAHYSIVLVASYIEKEEEKYYNTAVLIDENGVLLGKYRKIHLFPKDPMDETTVFTVGGFPQSDIVFRTKFCNMGLLICYDLRFPELSRRITLAGADLLIYVAEFPHPRSTIWTTLLQARAMENQLFVIGANRMGSDPNLDFCGNSVIFDPSGRILTQGTEKEEVLTAQLDPKVLQEVRASLPSLQSRQPSYY